MPPGPGSPSGAPSGAPAAAPKSATEDFVKSAVEKMGKDIIEKLKPVTDAVDKLTAKVATPAGTDPAKAKAPAEGTAKDTAATEPRVLSAEEIEQDKKTMFGRGALNNWIRRPLAMLGIGTGTALAAPAVGIPGLAAGPALWAAGKMKSWFTRREYHGVTRPIYEAMITPVQLAAAPFKLTHRAIMDGPGYVGEKIKKGYGWVKDNPVKFVKDSVSKVWNGAIKPVIAPTLPGVAGGALATSLGMFWGGSLLASGGTLGLGVYAALNLAKRYKSAKPSLGAA